MNWRKRILDYGKSLGRPTYEDAMGVGVAFEDGCDVFWVLPGEVMSTVDVPAEGPASVERLIAEYDAISHVRERALHVVRHYLASKEMHVDRRPSGQWGLEWADGASSSISVGAGLTKVARDTRDVYAVVAACIGHSWVRKVPSRKRIDRYLNTPGPPENERGPLTERPVRHLVPPTIRGVLGLMGVCRAMENAEALLEPDGARKASGLDGRIGKALLRLADRLPDVEASGDLLKPGTISIKFADGYGDYEVDVRSRDLARRIAADGSEAAGDQLADEYLNLNDARSRVFRAIHQAAAQRGWRKQEFGLALFGIERQIHLGQTRREVSISPGDKLTDLLRWHASPEEALRELLKENADFAEACIAALRDPQPGERIELPEAMLAPRDIPLAPPLRELDDDTIAGLDRFARETIAKWMTQRETLWKYRDPDTYDPAIDTWADRAAWVRAAERCVDDDWPDMNAVLILLHANDPRGEAAARYYLSRCAPHHEVSDAEVEVVWRYRHEQPDVARQWFAPSEPGEDVPFAEVRAKLGDPVALRRTTADEPAEDELDDDPARIGGRVERLSPQRLERLHAQALAWAREGHRWSPPDGALLRVAMRMGWRDIADALPQNPYLLSGLLTHDRRHDMFDEPGILLAGDFLLAWSRFAPGRFLAQVVATAHHTDLLAVSEAAARASAAGRPDVEKNVPMAIGAYHQWLKALEPALAIAWTRCRRVL